MEQQNAYTSSKTEPTLTLAHDCHNYHRWPAWHEWHTVCCISEYLLLRNVTITVTIIRHSGDTIHSVYNLHIIPICGVFLRDGRMHQL